MNRSQFRYKQINTTQLADIVLMRTFRKNKKVGKEIIKNAQTNFKNFNARSEIPQRFWKTIKSRNGSKNAHKILKSNQTYHMHTIQTIRQSKTEQTSKENEVNHEQERGTARTKEMLRKKMVSKIPLVSINL